MRRRRFLAGAIGTASGFALGPAVARADVPAPRAEGWQAVPAPGSTPAAQLRRIAAAGPQLAWAVGEEGRAGPSQGRGLAMLWNGGAWTKTDLSHLSHTRLTDVAGVCAASAWSVAQPVGTGSPLLRWDGTTWREATFPGVGESDVRLTAVAVGPDRQVWICGSRGGGVRLLHGDGGEWQWLDPLPVESASLYRVVLRSSGEVWVSGDQSNGGGWSGLVARWDGSWTVLPPIAGLRLGVADLHAAGPDDVWAVGTEAGIGGPPGRPGSPALSHWDGTSWTREEVGFTVGSLSGIAGDAQGRAVWITGWNYRDQSRSTYLHRDGDAWTVVRGPAGGTAPAPYLNDVTSVPGITSFWSVGMTSPTPAPPTEAYTERLE
ncbi:hypothetical protein [Streptomyces lanatus]|uniref:Uncharacterized protein n=1 Tax=Streptomyces lanatus TaxID=66900 RepID=A0ABV1XTI4_9ACTN|nr:hypothetical protein [Streptomyces lanatus]GHH09762.1 hypothetical protein GCM10018780_46020 [Streptomyces lanatus]